MGLLQKRKEILRQRLDQDRHRIAGNIEEVEPESAHQSKR